MPGFARVRGATCRAVHKTPGKQELTGQNLHP
jgi:hypothetical protein